MAPEQGEKGEDGGRFQGAAVWSAPSVQAPAPLVVVVWRAGFS